VDLATLALGAHNFKATGSWQQEENVENESQEANFNVSTSCKSVITLVNRLYAEEKVLSWGQRSALINLTAEAYQAHSNGDNLNAKKKLLTAYETLSDSDETTIRDALVKERIQESLAYLAEEPK